MLSSSDLSTQLPWHQPPLSFLSPQEQTRFQEQAKYLTYKPGDVIWNTEDLTGVFYLLSGEARLSDDETKKSIKKLRAATWFGDVLYLSGQLKIRASGEVQVAYWNFEQWEALKSDGLKRFWEAERRHYQEDEHASKAVPGYPFVFSLENSAAACLTMIGQYLQIPLELGAVKSKLQVRRHKKAVEAEAKKVVEAAERIGLQLTQLKLSSSLQELRQLSFPLLLQLSQQNWIVIYGVRGNRVLVANPNDADAVCKSIPRDKLEQLLSANDWKGTVWQVELIQRQEKFNLSWFLPVIWKYRWLLGEVLLLSVVLQVLGIFTPMMTQVIIDKAMVNQSSSLLNVMGIALVLTALFEAVFNILRLYIFTHTANRIDLRLSAQLFRHLLRLPLKYFENQQRRVGDTVARVQELENVRQFLTGTTLTVVLDGLFVFVYLGIMIFYSKKLTAIALLMIPLFAILTLVATPLLRDSLNDMFNKGAESQSFLTESITGIHAVKAHAAQAISRKRWEGTYARYIRSSFRASTISNISASIGGFFNDLSHLVLLWFGAQMVMNNQLRIGELIAFQMLSGKVTEPLLRLIQLWQEFQQVLLSVERLGDILNEIPEADLGTGQILPPLKGKVQFEQVFFRYPDSQEFTLKGISFTVEPGMFVGVVGRSGSGKSTLSKLLQRLYEPETGLIRLDDFELKTADIASLQDQIAVVLQEDILFKGSISENITLGKENVSSAEIEMAAKNSVAHDFIMNLPGGKSYDTELGERGIGLSGGQRQRIALARMFLSDARLIVLDEATSALDSETERTVLRNLRQKAVDRTVFMITHRFAPLKKADLILVLQDGRLEEKGTHENLLEKRGLYHSLYQRQLNAV